MANRLIILVSPGHYILSIHNGGDECNMYFKVLLEMLWHLKMVKIASALTTMMTVHALIAEIATIALIAVLFLVSFNTNGSDSCNGPSDKMAVIALMVITGLNIIHYSQIIHSGNVPNFLEIRENFPYIFCCELLKVPVACCEEQYKWSKVIFIVI